ncbi:MAG: PD40 domain-containing protein [Bacteroidales bacterium]|nr:PD40 domain-containing protein [Bacteroidales bacterium]
MNRILIFLLPALLYPGCAPRCTKAAANDNAEEMHHSDSVPAATMSTAAVKKPDQHNAKKNCQPDYFFAVALYNTVYYGNSLENMVKLDIASAQLDISPDGRTIAYSSYCKPGRRIIKMIDIETQEATFLDLPQYNVYMGSWNNNGNYLALNSQSTVYSHWQPILYNIETGEFFDIDWLDTDNDYYNPVFSPDGKRLVFHDICRIYICDFVRNHAVLKRVIDTEDLCNVDNAGFSDYCKFQISNDGNYLVFTVETDILEEDLCPKTTLCSYEINTGRLRRMTDSHCTVTDFAISSANEIYYCTCNKDKELFEGYMAHIDGSDPVVSATFKERTYAIAVAK